FGLSPRIPAQPGFPRLRGGAGCRRSRTFSRPLRNEGGGRAPSFRRLVRPRFRSNGCSRIRPVKGRRPRGPRCARTGWCYKSAMTIAKAIDWGSIAPLRLRARTIAEGVYAGAHRSLRKGAGVEFGGHRPYIPGDDLRWLDRRAVLRHDKLIVREFE